jgi:imidazolonepropionase
MSGSVLVRGARQLLTLRGPAEPRRGAALHELSIIRDGALLIEDGRIVEVGLSRRVENLASVRRSQEIDATGRVVMPGFVDCRAHLVWGVSALDDYEARIAAAIEEPPGGPAPPIHALRNCSANRLESRARQCVNAMIRHGTTTLGAESGYGFDARSELKILRVQARLNGALVDIASTFFAPGSNPAAHAGDPAGYLALMFRELMPAIRRRAYARFAGLRCAEWAFNMELGRSYLEAALALGFQLKVDAGEHGASDAVRLAVEVGAASVDGVQDAGAADVECLAGSNTTAVLLPGAVFQRRFRHRHEFGAPARQLIDGGAAVALGTDFSPGASSTYSMPAIIALACAHQGMSPAEAICAATFNAACAIGSTAVAGSLEVGKPADLIVLNASDYREIPYHFGANPVNRTVKRGVTVYQEGKVAPFPRTASG